MGIGDESVGHASGTNSADGLSVTTAVVLAVGDAWSQGSPMDRLAPAELWPVETESGVMPAMQAVIEDLAAAGINDIVVVCRAGEAERFRAYFWPVDMHEAAAWEPAALAEGERVAALGRRLRFIEQPAARGSGEALLRTQPFVGDRPVLVARADRVYESFVRASCAEQLIRGWEAAAWSGEAVAVSAVAAVSGADFASETIVRGAPVAGGDGLFAVDEVIRGPGADRAERDLRSPGTPLGAHLVEMGMHVFGPSIFGACERAFDGAGHCQLLHARLELLGASVSEGAGFAGKCVEGRSESVRARRAQDGGAWARRAA